METRHTRPSKRLSCKRCQFKKLRCSRTDPCDKCQEAHQTCEYRDDDRKRRPVSRQYVAGLENRIASLEALVMRIKRASPDERDRILEGMSFDQWLETSPPPDTGRLEPCSGHLEETCQPSGLQQASPQGLLIYHGPTSIYRIRAGDGATPSSTDTASQNQFDHVARHFGVDPDDQELVLSALHQFFHWQYPHFMFIYREAFLRDHFGRDRARPAKYWSLPLLLAICALGAVVSPQPEQARMGDQFYAAAESISIVSGLMNPSITAVQAFLCLAFYQIGKGNLSKGWELSGIAFRMAQDLGFQRDPRHWIPADASLETAEDVEIRRRIYWGCYASDKTISLILGRPVQLYEAAGQVQDAESLPDFPDMMPWMPAGVDMARMFETGVPGLREKLVTGFSEHIKLSKLIEKMICVLFSRKQAPADNTTTMSVIDDLDLQLCRWQESLPDCVKWNRWEPPTTSLPPSVAALFILFNSTRIALHMSQVQSRPDGGLAEMRDMSRSACASAAQDVVYMVRHYRSQHGLRHAPLIFIYGIVQAHRAMTALQTTPREVTYLAQSLDECCTTWGLAVQARAHLNESS